MPVQSVSLNNVSSVSFKGGSEKENKLAQTAEKAKNTVKEHKVATAIAAAAVTAAVIGGILVKNKIILPAAGLKQDASKALKDSEGIIKSANESLENAKKAADKVMELISAGEKEGVKITAAEGNAAEKTLQQLDGEKVVLEAKYTQEEGSAAVIQSIEEFLKGNKSNRYEFKQGSTLVYKGYKAGEDGAYKAAERVSQTDGKVTVLKKVSMTAKDDSAGTIGKTYEFGTDGKLEKYSAGTVIEKDGEKSVKEAITFENEKVKTAALNNKKTYTADNDGKLKLDEKKEEAKAPDKE